MTYHKDHTDYSARIQALKRWLPDRELGESTGNAMDARSDESLYKPSELGSATCSLKSVKAGENRPFELVYTAGKRELSAGDIVKFWMAGQGSLGTTPQIDAPDYLGYLSYDFPEHVEAEPVCDNYRVLSITHGENSGQGRQPGDLVVGPVTIGFKIVKGTLQEGDRVTIHVGERAGFIWKKLVSRKEFKLIVEPAGGGPKMRLPEPVRIYIKAREADHLDVYIPGTANQGETVKGVVSVRDKYDNRVHYDGPVFVHAGAETLTAYLSGGIGQFTCIKKDDKPLSIKVSPNKNLPVPESVSNYMTSSKNGYKLFFGDLHTHDFNSTAEGYPADCYQWARDEKKLDFQALAVQVHRWIDNEKWFLMKHMTEYFHEEGEFITFLSYEWQHSSCGDKIIHYLGNDMPYLPIDDPRYDDPEKLYAALKKSDAFIISHHPGYELDLHVPGARWEVMDTEIDRLVEIWSMHGSSEGYDITDRPLIPPFRKGGAYEGLQKGLRLGVTAGSDTHTARPGGSCDDVRPYYGGLCAVWAENLTRRSLFEAFKARRTYALTGARIHLYFSVNNAVMGSELPFSEHVEISLDVFGTEKISKIEIMKNAEVYQIFEPQEICCNIEYTDKICEPAFYHCRITQQDGHLAVSTPVWIG